MSSILYQGTTDGTNLLQHAHAGHLLVADQPFTDGSNKYDVGDMIYYDGTQWQPYQRIQPYGYPPLTNTLTNNSFIPNSYWQVMDIGMSDQIKNRDFFVANCIKAKMKGLISPQLAYNLIEMLYAEDKEAIDLAETILKEKLKA
jgi:hypothetical protein